MTNPAARVFGDWITGLEWTAIPPDLHPLIGMRTLDTLGLMLAGSHTRAADAVRAMIRCQGLTTGTAVLPAGERSPPALSALAHGVMAHCWDFDDTFPDSVVHPGSVVVTTALSVGESLGAEAHDIAKSVTIGYEVAARLGAVASRNFHRRGLHATGVIGPFAAAATAASLMDLDGETIAHAFGLAGSMASGLMAFLQDGSWSKWLHVGWSAHGGILAAQMAAKGFTGPAGVLDGRYSLYEALLAGHSVDTTTLTRNLGRVWHGAEAHFKYYPCAHVIQPYLDAAISVVCENDLRNEDIASVICHVAPWAAKIVAVPRIDKIRPKNEVGAVSSLPWQLAVALRERTVTLEALEEGMRSDPDLLSMARRVTHVEDPELGIGFDGVLQITLTNGRRFEQRASSPALEQTRLLRKFRANARRGTNDIAATRLQKAALKGDLPDFATIFSELGAKHSPS